MTYRVLPHVRAPQHCCVVPQPSTCEGRGRDWALMAALPQCSYHESGGARCESYAGHLEGHHVFTDAIFGFLQVRWGLQGPVCRTRRGPPEVIYVEDAEGW